METTAPTVDLMIEPRGEGGIQFLKDGDVPSRFETYPSPDGAPPEHGRRYLALYWGPDPPVWVSSAEILRLIGLAAGKDKPFPARVATVPPVPGLRPVERFPEDLELEWLDEDPDEDPDMPRLCRLVRRTDGGGAAKACP
jgi:hypothetical protein